MKLIVCDGKRSQNKLTPYTTKLLTWAITTPFPPRPGPARVSRMVTLRVPSSLEAFDWRCSNCLDESSQASNHTNNQTLNQPIRDTHLERQALLRQERKQCADLLDVGGDPLLLAPLLQQRPRVRAHCPAQRAAVGKRQPHLASAGVDAHQVKQGGKEGDAPAGAAHGDALAERVGGPVWVCGWVRGRMSGRVGVAITTHMWQHTHRPDPFAGARKCRKKSSSSAIKGGSSSS